MYVFERSHTGKCLGRKVPLEVYKIILQHLPLIGQRKMMIGCWNWITRISNAPMPPSTNWIKKVNIEMKDSIGDMVIEDHKKKRPIKFFIGSHQSCQAHSLLAWASCFFEWVVTFHAQKDLDIKKKKKLTSALVSYPLRMEED